MPPTDTIRPIYLDGMATTRLDPAALAAMLPYLEEDFGNASSRTHAYGAQAAVAVEAARREVAHLVGAAPDEIVFTSGATESDCAAIFGVARRPRGEAAHVITSRIEHKAVLECFAALEREGVAVTYLTPDAEGFVTASAVEQALRPDTVLVSLMLVNNEIGTVNPIAAIGALLRARGVIFHCDAAQAVGKMPVDVGALSVDLMSVSAHKLHGPKGIGALYVRRAIREGLAPLLRGGGQELGLRGGTLNVPGIVGFGAACAIAAERMAEDHARVAALRDRLFDRIRVAVPDVHLNGPLRERVCSNLNVSFPEVDGEALLVAVRDRIALSAGSACSAGSKDVSHVLRGIGLADTLSRCTLRFGLTRFTTADEVDRAADVVVEAVTRLRRAPRQALNREAVASTRAGPAAPAGALGLTAVGVVRNDVTEPKYIPWADVVSRIVVDDAWKDGLHGIEAYSHLVVVYWLHHVDAVRVQHVCQGLYDVCPRVGMFASRSPYRVNPLGITTVRLLGLEGNVLLVQGLDAVDGSPVVDIKPYTPRVDEPQGEVAVPEWVDELVF